MRCRKVEKAAAAGPADGRPAFRRAVFEVGRELRYNFGFFLLLQQKLFGRPERGDGCVHDHL